MDGNCILVIRRADRFSAILQESGFDTINLELVETHLLEDLSDLRSRLTSVRYDGLFFTSPIAAEAFVKIKAELNGLRSKAYVLGKRSREVLRDSPLELCYVDEANTADEMIDGFDAGEFTGKRFLFVRGDRSLRTIPEKLKDIAGVDEVVVYLTRPRAIAESLKNTIEARLSRGEIGWTCFFSPSGVDEYLRRFGETARNTAAAVIGSTTAEAARRADLTVKFVSPVAEAEGFARSLIEHIAKGD
jgi:uroporphyrinogen-III synthase